MRRRSFWVSCCDCPCAVTTGAEGLGTEAPSPGYMPWVDGLRAVSILGVVAFHAGISSVPGGFTGVDVFFVISGFLIIGQITAGLKAGNFTVLGFYARRVMRILPTYFLMIAIVSTVAPFLLIVPKSFEMQAKGAVLAPLMVSNILFFLEQGYFDASAEHKPFIHTWTLSVEEQFYLVIPLALILLYRLGGKRFGSRAGYIAAVAGLVSFAACVQLTTVVERNPAFYLTHLRAWEFIAGGFALPVGKLLRDWTGQPLASGLSLLGLGLVAGGFFGLNGSEPFPGWRALIPVSGAMLILAGTTARPESSAAKALSHPIPVHIGLISYSWYLWHWPLFSLASLAGYGPESWRGVLFAGVLGYIAAEISHRFVELPVKAWRFRRAAQFGDRKIFAAGILTAASVAILCGGLTGLGYLRNNVWLENTYGLTSKERVPNGCHAVTEDRLNPECLTGNYALLLGDSHADAVAAVFASELRKYGWGLVAIARGGCDPARFTPDGLRSRDAQRCTNLIAPIESVLAAENAPKTAIIVSSFSDEYSKDPADVAKLAGMFNARGTAVLFVGPAPVFPKPVIECIVTADRFGSSRDECAMPRAAFTPRDAAAGQMINAGISGLTRAVYAPISGVFCDKFMCRPWDGNTVYFSDASHVAPSGAKRIFQAVEPALRELLKPNGAPSKQVGATQKP